MEYLKAKNVNTCTNASRKGYQPAPNFVKGANNGNQLSESHGIITR
jgi:hypothetical protein